MIAAHTTIQRHLDRLQSLGWTRDQIAAPTGYTLRQLQSWASGRPPPLKPALAIGLVTVLSSLKGPPPAPKPTPAHANPKHSLK